MLKKVPWGILDLLFVYILSMFLSYQLAGWGVMRFNQWLAGHHLVLTESYLFFTRYLMQFAVYLLVILAVILGFHRGRLSDLGLKKPRFNKLLIYGLGGGFVIVFIIMAFSMVIEMLQPELAPQPFENILRTAKGPLENLLIITAGVILAPMVEELFYRGMVYPVFRSYFGVLGGCLFSGFLFGLAHWDLWRAVPLAVGGALLCWVYEKTDSIWVSMCAHGVWNATVSYFVLVSVHFV